jgi:hypothetical protein
MQKKLHKFELAALANLCPENAEEAKALIPRFVTLFSLQSLVFDSVHSKSVLSIHSPVPGMQNFCGGAYPLKLPTWASASAILVCRNN